MVITCRINPTELLSEIVFHVSHVLDLYLSLGSTLLLVSGGSVGTEVFPLVAKNLIQKRTSLEKLSIGLVDERFGKPWHPASNMLILKNSGSWDLFSKAGATWYFPLTTSLETLQNTGQTYEKTIDHLLKQSSGRTIGLFGIGSDGHTAGIKPDEDSVRFSHVFAPNELVTAYRAVDFERITLTPYAIDEIYEVVVYALGDRKKKALQTITTGKRDTIHIYPGIVFAGHKNAHLFTDQLITT